MMKQKKATDSQIVPAKENFKFSHVIVVDFLFIVTPIVRICNCFVVRCFVSILALQSS